MNLGNIELRPYQVEAIDFHLKRRWSINAFQVGLGKTYVALASARESKAESICVVCPAYLKKQWEHEAKIVEVPCSIFSYDAFRKTKEVFDYYIFDEAHYLKNVSAKRTIDVFKHLESRPFAYRHFLTGTPIKNEVTDIYTLLKLTDFDRSFSSSFPTLNKFGTHFCYKEEVYLPYATITKFKGIRKEKLTEIKFWINKHCIVKKSEEVLNLPKKNRNMIRVAGFKSNEIEEGKILEMVSSGDISHLMAIKSKIARTHVPRTCDRALEVLNEKDRLIIYTDHVEPAIAICKRLQEEGVRSAYVIGASSVSERSEIFDQFKRGHVKVIVATIGSFSTGLNMQFCNHMIFNDFPWTTSDLEQAEGRIYRSGQTKPVFIEYMISDSIQDKIFKLLTSKKKLQTEILK